MTKKTFVKCNYYEVYADVIVHDGRRRGQAAYDTVEEQYNKIVTGEFDAVSWDGEKRELQTRQGRKRTNLHEFDYSDYYVEGILESTRHVHIATWIEYLAIDDFVVIDKREEISNEEMMR